MFNGVFEEFMFEGESEDGKFYTKDVKEFDFITSKLPIEETGISFSGEVEVGEGVSVITDKQVKMGNPEDSKKTYIKVIEYRELTEAERLHVSKVRLVLKKLFDVFFNKSKVNLYLSLFWGVIATLEVKMDDYFWALIYTSMIIFYNHPIKFAKELKKIVGNKKEVEKLEDELVQNSLLGYANSIPEDEGIQLYFKPKAPTM